ncbi:MAG: hypothetical protein PHC84_03960 [Clostridia bacterium]|nr:hypothetical protein [Clostridia bacterium]
MIVLHEHRRLTESESCRHIYIPFEAPCGGNALTVKFSFQPATLEDRQQSLEIIRRGMEIYEPGIRRNDAELEEFLPLKNMLTLSIDSPDGFIGAAHRHSVNQLHKISAQKSSRGFVPCAVTKGRWIITVSPFHFVTPYVDFDLEVSIE